MRNNLLLGVAAVALIAPMSATAQETTSAIRGTVTAGGTPVAGATVTITNTSTNARVNTTTGADGSFNANGLPVGGPYTVAITSPQGSRTVTDIFTVVQQPFTLPVDLAPAATGDATADAGAGEDIVVTASSIRGAGVTSDGPQTVLTQADVSKVASVNRDIRDIQRRDPFANLDLSNSGDRGGAVSFAGVNPRYNRFTINGVTVGDTFGLNQDASPTNRGPVPFDAIAQVSVSIAPYDFRQSGFQGGAIDTVLLSGTNDFHGTGFYSQNTDGLTGDTIGSIKQITPKYKSETYGATLRGPLIADKLFFMVSAERNTDPRPFSTLLGSYANPAGLQTSINNVVAIANNRGLGNFVGNVLTLNPRKDEKITGRVDWNITDGQRLSVSYINAYDALVSQNNTSTSATQPSYGLSSNAYALTELLKAGIVQLNSDWTDKFSTEARAIYKYNKRGQEPLLGRGIGQLGVCSEATATAASTTTGCANGNARVFFGPDNNRQINQLFFDTWEGSLLGRYTAGTHQIQALVDVTQNRTFNNFVPNALGNYYFDSLADFQAGNANQLTYAAPIPGVSPAADFRYTQFAFGLQDEWQVTDTLAVTYGARYSLYAQKEVPVLNPFFAQRVGYGNTETYNGLDQFEPRFSFDWKPDNFLGGLKLRGGAGIFGGGSPDIYMSNSFSNTITTSSVVITRSAAGANTCTGGVPNDICVAALNNVTGNVPASVAAYAANTTNPTTLQRTNTGALARDFHLPRSLKATLSGDYRFMDFNLGADYYYSNTIDGVIFVDGRSVPIGVLPDGRPRYGSLTAFADNNYDIITTNTSKGHSHVIVARASKDFDWGLSLGGSVTRSWIYDVGNATSSTINSNYRNQAFADPNNPAYGISSDQIKWQIKYNVGFDHKFFGDNRTVFQLFGETRAGRPFSYTMLDNVTTRSSVFGTVLTSSGANTNLFYVPTGLNDPRVSYGQVTTTVNGVTTVTQTADAAAQALDAYISGSVLNKYRGQIAPKNIGRNRAFTRIDLHVEQEIPTFIGNSKISLFADINNLPNLLNSKWGGLRQLGFPYSASLVNVQCLTTAGNANNAGTVATSTAQPCAQYRYSSYANPNLSSVTFTQSLYQIRLGARFTF
ncbi:TonB-dependent receptor [Sphingomonas sp. RHCKR47]|uniref:TonB-dependent receptor n=1 Tax=Sphingomonas citricola TaxID=2862498 RepID=UPI001C67D8D1|nr:TonB-dependent receptor [Sphingomonas citricola]MBW6524836.1 TonB-dependent receptor [Sphingomonas citricola]